jgi:hypothetical protein
MAKNKERAEQEKYGFGESTKKNIDYWAGVAASHSYHGEDAPKSGDKRAKAAADGKR